MRTTLGSGLCCLCVVSVVLAGLDAQAATKGYWRFDEKSPGNPADIDPITGAIQDQSGYNHNGTAFGGDPLGTGVVMPRYVDGAAGSSHSAMRFTLQDWTLPNTACGPYEDLVYVPHSSDFDINLSGDDVYTIEAIIRAPDPMAIMDWGLYHGQHSGSGEFPQWCDYTDNAIIGKPSSGPSRWVFRMTNQGHPALALEDSAGHWLETWSTGTATGGLWHHVAAKIYASPNNAARKVEYYIDGAKTNEASLTSVSGVIRNWSGLMIGACADETGYPPWNSQFIGDIDAVRISTGAVTFLPTPTNTVPPINITHVGATDPNTESPLRLCDRFAGQSSNSSTWTPSGYTLASARFQEFVNSAAYYRALLAPEQLQDPTGWTLTGTMKLGASNKPWSECLGVQDGKDSWVMSFMDPSFRQASGDQGAGVYKSGAYHFGTSASDSYYTGVEKLDADGSVNIDPTAGFHHYQMIYDPTGDGGNGIAKFFVNGSLLGTQTRAEAADVDPADPYSSGCRFWFGDSYPTFYRHEYYSGDSWSDAYWGTVKMQTGAHLAVRWDPNFDGVCGAADLDIVRANWGLSRTPEDWEHGELTGDGVVGAADLDLIRTHWGWVAPAPDVGPVPEPSTIVLLAIGCLVLLFRQAIS